MTKKTVTVAMCHKKEYLTPMVEQFYARVESGFAGSGTGGSGTGGGTGSGGGFNSTSSGTGSGSGGGVGDFGGGSGETHGREIFS